MREGGSRMSGGYGRKAGKERVEKRVGKTGLDMEEAQGVVSLGTI